MKNTTDSRSVISRAFWDTVNFFGWNLRTLAVPALGLIGSAVHFYRAGWESAWEEINVMLSYAVIPMGILTILIFLWNIFLAPFRLLEESSKFDTSTKKSVDFEAWDQVGSLYFYQAACLWGEEEPNESLENYGGAAVAYYNMLKSAADEGKIPYVDEFSESPVKGLSSPKFYKTGRDTLIKFAKSKGLKPKFLFPGQR